MWTQQQRRAWEPVHLQRSRCRGDASSSLSTPGYKALPVPAVGPGAPGPEGLFPNTAYGYRGRRLRVLVKEVGYHWRELPQVYFLSRQKYACRDKHNSVATQMIFVAAPASDSGSDLFFTGLHRPLPLCVKS